MFYLLNCLAHCTLLDVSSVCSRFFDCEETHVFLWLHEPWAFLFSFFFFLFFENWSSDSSCGFYPLPSFFKHSFPLNTKFIFLFAVSIGTNFTELFVTQTGLISSGKAFWSSYIRPKNDLFKRHNPKAVKLLIRLNLIIRERKFKYSFQESVYPICDWGMDIETSAIYFFTFLRGCSHQSSFSVVFPLNRGKDIIFLRSYMKYFPTWTRFISAGC